MTAYRPLTEAEIRARRNEPSPEDIALIDATAAKLGRNVMYIPPADRQRMATAMMVQPPAQSADLREFRRFMEQHKMIQGLPADVLIRLQTLEDLADQGNSVAAWIFTRECEKFGITFARRF